MRRDNDTDADTQGPEGEDEESLLPEVIEIPVDGTLDLHHFRPEEVGELVPDYLEECLDRGILDVRIIHGKGRGVLRRKVHAALQRSHHVSAFGLDEGMAGGWGATWVKLRPR